MLSQSLRVLSVRDQASICPFALREVSVLAELALGHLRYSLTDVPPQSNSPPGGVLGIRIAPGPGPAGAARAPTARLLTAGRRRADAARGLTPGALGWCLTLPEYQPRPGATGTGRRRGDRVASAGRAGAGRSRRRSEHPAASGGPTAGGRTRPRPEPRVPLYRVSGETMRVVVFQGRRGDGRPRDRPPGPPSPTYATPRHVSEQCQIRVKLNRVFFPR